MTPLSLPFALSDLTPTLVNFTRLVRDRTRGRDGALVLGQAVWVLAFVVAVAARWGGIEQRSRRGGFMLHPADTGDHRAGLVDGGLTPRP